MASHRSPELDDGHRWLPPEIFADVGILRGPPAARRRFAAVEDLAAQLAFFGLLGPAKKSAPPPLPPPVTANSYYHPEVFGNGGGRRQLFGLDGDVLVAGGCGGGGRAVVYPFLPAPAVRWQVEEGFGNDGRVLDLGIFRRPARFAPAKRRTGGTGVFLPRAEVYQARTAKSADVKLQEWQQKQQLQPPEEEEAMEMQKLHAMAAEMEKQQLRAAAAAAATAPFHACPELALPQEWTY